MQQWEEENRKACQRNGNQPAWNIAHKGAEASPFASSKNQCSCPCGKPRCWLAEMSGIIPGKKLPDGIKSLRGKIPDIPHLIHVLGFHLLT
jgi:hypothetical protein